ncbi:hypothetical protein EBR96_09035, partial [bacterium]|nr:hypothetical protein [bacterium]
NESATLAATPVDVAAAPAPVPSSAVPEPIPQGAVSVQEPEPESSPVLAAATGKSPDAPKVPPPAVKIILTQIEELLKPELLILDVVQTEPALSQPNPGGKLPNMVKDGPLPVQIRVTPEPLAKPALLGEKSDLGSVVLRVDPATVTPAPTSEKPPPAPTSSVIIKAVGALAEASRSPVVPERSTSTPGSPPPTGNPGSVPAAASPSSGPSVLAGPNVIFKLMDTAVRQLPDRVQEMVISKIQTVWDHQPEAALRLVKAIEQMPGASAKEVSLSDIMTAPVPHLTDIGKVIVNVSRAEPAVLPVVLDLIQTVAARQPETLPVIARAVNQIIARQPDIVAQSSMPKNVVAQTVQLLANAANSEARPATVGALIAESHVRLPAAATTTPASGPGLSLPVGSRLEAIATAIVRTAKEAPQVLAETVRTFESIILAESSLSDSKSPMASGHEMAIELPTPHLDFSIHTARVQTEFVADLIKSTTLPARHSEPLNQLIRAVSQLGNAKYEAAVVQISRLTVEHPKL